MTSTIEENIAAGKYNAPRLLRHISKLLRNDLEKQFNTQPGPEADKLWNNAKTRYSWDLTGEAVLERYKKLLDGRQVK